MAAPPESSSVTSRTECSVTTEQPGTDSTRARTASPRLGQVLADQRQARKDGREPGKRVGRTGVPGRVERLARLGVVQPGQERGAASVRRDRVVPDSHPADHRTLFDDARASTEQGIESTLLRRADEDAGGCRSRATEHDSVVLVRVQAHPSRADVTAANLLSARSRTRSRSQPSTSAERPCWTS